MLTLRLVSRFHFQPRRAKPQRQLRSPWKHLYLGMNWESAIVGLLLIFLTVAALYPYSVYTRSEE